ncbi:hypothetical protein BGW36DRAFT_286994 [Talaromyces proteolyticus]|uniref:Phosphoglycerate mutase family protein n=1 Tax=Talaromyces proteolyticus TaxID=1131652 RepID=A0AAD4KWZ7_9EURO|nr:uncharacterized protein BGW36DRAFT_286994 [Talaromyces proteolyticus]KAH8703076.1 hypothetical protein BGW36DRAFT_286994 [Talaromyces proteolyticus]
MEKPPAVVIIARHGARIDAVDKEWHLTSPTPYDPPLTYGGWLQGRALGARIASLLRAREESVQNHSPTASSSTTTLQDAVDSGPEELHQRVPKKVRQHRVVIHSSPFLRCVQTSIAISAGMSQYHRVERERLGAEGSPTPDISSEEISPSTSPFRSSTPNMLERLAKSGDKDKINGHAKQPKAVSKTRLRIDAFLGEWLSPDYYDQITPPPGSVMMVAGAKADLLRRGEGLPRANDSAFQSPTGHFPGGWKNSSLPSSPATDNEEDKFPGMGSLADALPQVGRSGHDDGLRGGRLVKGFTIRDVLSRAHSHNHEEFFEGYIPPLPSYAISPADSIPAGYVAHARDACVDVDYQWDSMRDPPNWGDGGEYGEEWSAMHKRFRNGLLNLLDWYAHEKPQSHGHHHRHHHHHEDDETDTVVVLVTHGAGCNALIGALTNQPVLIDVAMASLTMAVRKDVFKIKDSDNQPRNKKQDEQDEHTRQVSDISVLEAYDLSLIASTEHLDVTSNPLAIPQLPHPGLERSRSISAYRHRGDGRPVLIPNSYEISTQPTRNPGLHRAATTNSSRHHRSREGSGLWGSMSSEVDKDSVLEEKDSMPYFSQPGLSGSNPNEISPQTSINAKPSSSKPPLEEVKSQRGLWSSAITAQEREPATKRRWTVSERR